MKRVFWCLLFILFFSGHSSGQINFNINIGDKKRERTPPPPPVIPVEQKAAVQIADDYQLGMISYYNVSQSGFMELKAKGLGDDDVNVVLYLSSAAKVKPDDVARMRLSGMGFLDISMKIGVNEEVFSVPVKDPERHGPPYGKAYGHDKSKKDKKEKKDKKHKKAGKDEEGGSYRYSDKDIKDLVYVKFASTSLGVDVDSVIESRKRGESYKEFKGKKKKR